MNLYKIISVSSLTITEFYIKLEKLLVQKEFELADQLVAPFSKQLVNYPKNIRKVPPILKYPRSVFHIASVRNDLDIAKWAMKWKFPLDLKGHCNPKEYICSSHTDSENWQKPIHVACELGHKEIVSFLLEQDSRLIYNICRSSLIARPLSYAIKSESLDLIELLSSYDKRAKYNIVTDYNPRSLYNPLGVAVTYCSLDFVETFFNNYFKKFLSDSIYLYDKYDDDGVAIHSPSLRASCEALMYLFLPMCSAVIENKVEHIEFFSSIENQLYQKMETAIIQNIVKANIDKQPTAEYQTKLDDLRTVERLYYKKHLDFNLLHHAVENSSMDIINWWCNKIREFLPNIDMKNLNTVVEADKNLFNPVTYACLFGNIPILDIFYNLSCLVNIGGDSGYLFKKLIIPENAVYTDIDNVDNILLVNFVQICRSGNLDALKWFEDRFHILEDKISQSNYLDMLDGKNESLKIYDPTSMNGYLDESILNIACEMENIDMAIYIYQQIPELIDHKSFINCFETVAENGNLVFLKWLSEIKPQFLDNSVHFQSIENIATENSHEHIVSWLNQYCAATSLISLNTTQSLNEVASQALKTLLEKDLFWTEGDAVREVSRWKEHVENNHIVYVRNDGIRELDWDLVIQRYKSPPKRLKV